MSENKKDLKYFMRNTQTEIVTAPGPSSFKDENGKVIQFEIKVLSQEQINKINDAYRRKSMATDKKGNPLIAMGEVVWKTEKDNEKSVRHMIVKALQYPDLKNKELMDYYGCVDITTKQGKIYKHRMLARDFDRLLEVADIEHKLLHCLRHTFSTQMLRENENMIILSSILGHTTPTTTYHIYIHLLDEEKKTAIQLLDD
ncbi:MAG: tyrosine-type recombinase/integrase [Firmicutes bacterium]|jgi:integrase|nr:tyrosine-type recombinase/integrase [Bacillota bacterium]